MNKNDKNNKKQRDIVGTRTLSSHVVIFFDSREMTRSDTQQTQSGSSWRHHDTNMTTLKMTSIWDCYDKYQLPLTTITSASVKMILT